MKCKCGDNVHATFEKEAKCILGSEFEIRSSGLFDWKNKPLYRYFYKGNEYSIQEITRFCELKAFL